jgi:prepilin peptidase dependent protein B
MLNARRRVTRPSQRGMSLVELFVGIAIGLIVVAGTLNLYVTHLTGSRKLQLEARLNQDLRAAADLVARDLRRASFWDNALSGTVAVGVGGATSPNPYRSVSTPAGDTIEYGFSRDVTENNALDVNEHFGFRLEDGALKMQTAEDSWQTVTDPQVISITAFSVTPVTTTLPLGHLCTKGCPVGTPNCPTTTVRRFDIVLRGRAVADSQVVRELQSTVRMRNDRLEGQCPV